ncbi:Crp/Fnr family transcriptional regulator [Sinomicrobium sp. M5D2P17]
MIEPEKYLAQLKQVFLRYYPVSESSLSLLEAIAKIEQVKKNEILLPAGTTAKNVHILCEGAIIAYFIDNDGNTYNKNIFLEGDFVSSTVSCLKNTPSEFTLEAIETSVIISFNYKKYRTLIEENKDLKDFYIAYLENNWVFDKEKREIGLVMKNATTRYLEFVKQYPDIDNRIPLRYISSHLGITPTQLSRIRRNLNKK